MCRGTACMHWCAEKLKKIAIRTLTIRSELPPLEMAVPLSPTREGRVWDIQLVTMAIVLSTAPIFSMGTLMSASCGALQPAQPCPLMNLGSRQPGHRTSLSDPTNSPGSCPASQSGWRTVPGVQQHWLGHGDAGRLVLGEQITSSSITLDLPSQSDCLLLPSLPPSLCRSLPPFLSSPSFLKMQSWAPAASISQTSLCRPVLQLNKFSSFSIFVKILVINVPSTFFIQGYMHV